MPNNNTSTQPLKNGTNSSGNRAPRKFFVSVDSPTNDPFHASPVDISHYSVNSATNKKLSFPSTQESDSNLRLLKGKQMLSSFNPFTKLSHSLETPYKQPSIKPLDDTPILFSASASVGKYIHPYHTSIKPTKNIGLTLTFVHSPSSSNPSLKSRGKKKHNLLYFYNAYKSIVRYNPFNIRIHEWKNIADRRFTISLLLTISSISFTQKIDKWDTIVFMT